MPTVHLLRHGEVYNPAHVLYGRLDGYGLSDLGRRMADTVAEDFARRAADGADVVVVKASPLLRAQQTAAPLGAALGLPVGTEPRVIEAENHFEGLRMTRDELRRPKHWPYLINPLRPSWGEAYRAQVARVVAAVHDVRAEAESAGGPDAEAVMVSHQLPIWVTRLSAERRPLWHDPRKRECGLASVTSFHFTGGDLTGVSYREPAGALLSGADQLPGA
ncbi:histidine phosphatase family protein [Tersicoccus sp. Bi-70]|uniref:histidine phosphatase family protein n=1 Tax=Tersicoccus sp. Bi-70 TaxID=1897634 RepID=UPI0009764993|nr:histidine phosphatase family protein [Tersicoccus sp. Bi-70]OMH34452.1 fructose-2,6-bisphosphatase [Tersicoccus sp. Bi-70]